MRLAVIGSGAAAHAVLAEIRRLQPQAQVDVYDAGEPPTQASAPGEPQHYDAVYKNLKRRYGLKFPPPKSHFGSLVDSTPGAQMASDWQHPGGLTNYWGATSLPFTESQLQALGMTRALLEPYYARVAQLLGIAGDANSAFAQHIDHTYIKKPAPRRLRLFEKLDSVLNQNTKGDFVAGGNCVALDTQASSATSCTYCGHCLAGCYRGAVFCSDSEQAHANHPDQVNRIESLVQKVDLAARRVHYQLEGSSQISPAYERVFIAAGCFQSTAIALRSTDYKEAVELYDNAIVQFPVWYSGAVEGDTAEYFALSQSLISCKKTGVQIQMYPFADHIFRSAVPELLWPVFKRLAHWLRSRVVIARLYLHSDCSHRYRMQLVADEIQFQKIAEPDRSGAREVIASLRSALKPGKFSVVSAALVGTSTSSHFASSLTETNLVSVDDGRLAEGVFVCDGSLFRESPTASPTFSIMANAARIAEMAL